MVLFQKLISQFYTMISNPLSCLAYGIIWLISYTTNLTFHLTLRVLHAMCNVSILTLKMLWRVKKALNRNGVSLLYLNWLGLCSVFYLLCPLTFCLLYLQLSVGVLLISQLIRKLATFHGRLLVSLYG